MYWIGNEIYDLSFSDRLKGLQPITKAAKEKQVEKLEEQYNKQKKGMEGKIVELESELQENLNTWVVSLPV